MLLHTCIGSCNTTDNEQLQRCAAYVLHMYLYECTTQICLTLSMSYWICDSLGIDLRVITWQETVNGMRRIDVRVFVSCTQTRSYGWRMAILQDPYDIIVGVRLVGGRGWG